MKRINSVLLSKNLSNIMRHVNVLKISFPDLSVAYDVSTINEILLKQDPGIIIIDAISIPDSSTLVKYLRNFGKFDKKPILLITASDNNAEGVAALREGASDYFSYNVSDEEFYLRINHQLHCVGHHLYSQEVSQFDDVYPLEDRAILLASERYIHNFMEDTKSVAHLANSVGISERKINEIYKLHAHVSAAEYIRSRKINKAKELLTTTRMTINQIALKTGYSSAANFSTAFKQIEGISPGEYKSLSRKT